MDNLEKLGKQSIVNIKNTIDFILDEYKGTKKQITYLNSLSKILIIEEEILLLFQKYKSAKNKFEEERVMNEIDDLLGTKQKICKDTIKIIKNNV